MFILFPSRGNGTLALGSECKTEQTHNDWTTLLPSNFIEEISHNPKTLNANT